MGNSLGSMFSGYLQAAAYKNLNGVHGLAGWQWVSTPRDLIPVAPRLKPELTDSHPALPPQLFIVDGVITLPIAFIGFSVFPGLPTSRKPWFLTEEEHERAKTRMDAEHKQAGKITFGVVKRTLARPMWWFCVSIYVLLIQASYWTGYMSLWLKASQVYSPELKKNVAKYSVEQINVYPTFVNLIAALSSWIGTTLAGGGIFKPWQVYSFAQFWMLFAVIVLTAWNVPDALKFFAFYVGGFSGMTSPILVSSPSPSNCGCGHGTLNRRS